MSIGRACVASSCCRSVRVSRRACDRACRAARAPRRRRDRRHRRRHSRRRSSRRSFRFASSRSRPDCRTRGASRFCPTADMLVTEREGRLRIIRNGVLDPDSDRRNATVFARVLAGLLDVALHPKFAENRLVYLSYSKAREDNLSTTALARARLRRHGAQRTSRTSSSPTRGASRTRTSAAASRSIATGLLYLTVGERQEQDRAQKPDDHGGKVLRLRDDGTRAAGQSVRRAKPGYLPEIYSIGHRSPQGLAMNPATGAHLGERARPARRRRAEHRPAGQELRLAARDLRHRLRRHEDQRFDVARGSRGAVRLLGAVDCRVRAHVLYRRPLSRVEGERVRRRDVRRDARAARVTSSGSSSTRPGGRSIASRC